MPAKGSARQERILLFRLSALGDVVMLLPVLHALEAQYPEVEVVLVSQPFAAGLVSQFSNVRLLPARIRAEHKGLRGLWRLAGEIMAQGAYVGIADMHSVLRVWLIRFFLRVRSPFHLPKLRAISKGRRAKSRLVRPKHKQLQPLEHSVQRYADVLARLGYPVEVPGEVGGYAGGAIPTGLLEILDTPSPNVGFAPFAKHKGKIYPLDRARLLVQELVNRGSSVFLFGAGEQELQVFRAWKDEFPSLVLVPDWGLRFEGELAVMARLAVMISMDSANMHLASWAGAPVVSVWGATHPFAGFLGWGQSLANTIQEDELSCRPCSIYGNRPCRRGDYACLAIPHQRIANRAIQVCSPES